MSRFDDDGAERFRRHMDDALIEALLAGRPADREGFASLAAFVQDVRVAANGPVPEPSPRLAAILTDGLSTQTDGSRVMTGRVPSGGGDRSRWRRMRMALSKYIAGLGLAAKVGLSVGIAGASVTAAGAAGVLPGPAQHVVADVVDTVSPFSVPGGADTAPPPPPPTTVVDGPTTLAPAPTGDQVPGPAGAPGGSGSTPTEPPTTLAGATGPAGGGPTEHHVALSIALGCSPSPAAVACTWTAAPAGAARFVLLRVTPTGPGRVVLATADTATLSATDSSVSPGIAYGYRVDALNPDGSVAAASNLVTVTVAGDAPATPPASTPPPSGDTTTVAPTGDRPTTPPTTAPPAPTTTTSPTAPPT